MGAIYIVWDVRPTADELGWTWVWWVMMVAAVTIAIAIAFILLTRWKELSPEQRKRLIWLFLIA